GPSWPSFRRPMSITISISVAPSAMASAASCALASTCDAPKGKPTTAAIPTSLPCSASLAIAIRFEFKQTVAQWLRRAISQASKISWFVAAGSRGVGWVRAASSERVHCRLIGPAYEVAPSDGVKGQNVLRTTSRRLDRVRGEGGMAGLISRGFLGRRRPAEVESRLPPGQYLVTD